MTQFSTIIPFTPKPKASVRLGKSGFFNPSSRGMARTAEHVRKNLTLEKPLKGPLLIIAHFVMPSPKHAHVSARRKRHLQPHCSKPDVDNLEKYLSDALRGIVWEDDAQICWMILSKSSTVEIEVHTFLYVQELDSPQPDYQGILASIKNNIDLQKGTIYAL